MSSVVSSGTEPGREQGHERRLSPLMPVRDDSDATLSGLVDALLTKGVYLDLDLIVTVAGIPLIGVSLRAAIAGMETLLEYGMMRDWDEKTRAWVRDSTARQFPLAEDEQVLARMAGSHQWHDPLTASAVWQPGMVYLTSRRLLVFRPEPAGILWEAPLASIRDMDVRVEHLRGTEPVSRLHVTLEDESSAVLTAARPGHLRDMVLGTRRPALARGEARNEDPSETTGETQRDDHPGLQGELWFEEQRSSGSIWRPGSASYDADAGFTWRGEADRRPSVRLAPHEIRAVSLGSGETPTGEAPTLTVATSETSFSFAGPRLENWEKLLKRGGT